jgi:hypothetical protein
VSKRRAGNGHECNHDNADDKECSPHFIYLQSRDGCGDSRLQPKSCQQALLSRADMRPQLFTPSPQELARAALAVIEDRRHLAPAGAVNALPDLAGVTDRNAPPRLAELKRMR